MVNLMRRLLDRALPFLRDEADKYEDDGSNEPLELVRYIEQVLQQVPDLGEVSAYAYMLQLACHERSVAAGWWNCPVTGEPSTPEYIQTTMVPQKLLLIHSEISEACEAHRKNTMDSHLPHRNGVEVELADAMIRILDLAGGLGLDIGAAMAEKMAYNAQRADHKLEARMADGGKRY